MSANFYAWVPSLALDAQSRSFVDDVEALYDTTEEPHPELQRFVSVLLKRFPDFGAEDAAWASGPLQGEIVGRFINVGVSWKRSDEVWEFFRDTAKAHGLYCYDPQAEKLYTP